MTKTFLLIPACCLALSAAFAQGGSSDLFNLNSGSSAGTPAADTTSAEASPSPATVAKSGTAQPSGPTIITSSGDVTYDEKTRMAVFDGEYYGVFVKDPQFTVNCDKLTAYLRQTAGTAAAGSSPAKGAVKGKASPDASAKGNGGDQKGSGLQRAIAEGPPERPIVIKQDKIGSDGKIQHDIGVAYKADYNADTGDIVLTGWPRVSQGINTQIATSEGTIMIMNRNNNTMRTEGPSQTVITEQQDDSKKSSSDSASSPSPAASIFPNQ